MQTQAQALKPKQNVVEVCGNQINGFHTVHRRASIHCRATEPVALHASPWPWSSAMQHILRFASLSHRQKLERSGGSVGQKLAVFCIDRRFGRFLSLNCRSIANSCTERATQATDPYAKSNCTTSVSCLRRLDPGPWRRHIGPVINTPY